MKADEDEQAPLLSETHLYCNGNTPHDEEGHEGHEDGQFHGVRLWLAIGFPSLALLLVAMDVTLVSTLSASMATAFSALSLVSWLGSSYLVASAVVQPLCGKLSDMYGRRCGFFVALALFALGNVACGIAPQAWVLIAGRIIAGLGGGAINCICAFITTDLVPLRQRTVWSGIADVVWAVGIGLGGVVGGLVNDWVGWRWAFLGAIPITLVVAIGVSATLTIPQQTHTDEICSEGQPGKLDLLGAATVTAAVTCLTVGLLALAEQDSVVLASGLLAASLPLTICFVYVESAPSTPNPIMPLYLLKDRSISMACLAGFFVAGSMHSLLYYVPFLIQVRGFRASEVGVQMLGELVGASVGSLGTGIVIKNLGGYKAVKPVVFLLYLVAPCGFMLSDLDTSPWVTVAILVAMGAGFGSVLTVLLISVLSLTERHVQATATSMLYSTRQTGAACGVAASGIILGLVTAAHAGGHQPVDLPNVAEQCDRHLFPGPDRPRICVVFGDGLHQVFVLTTILGVVGLVCSFMIRSRSLTSQRGETVGA
ncbi:drug:H+ antiporter-2 [Apiospora saccharicola]|uniref:Drug:H+ antiporter-2 n=1 Tax=Apiospora saccharicola TaxID=335842 RepID=A0ABR1UP41_9PEZI